MHSHSCCTAPRSASQTWVSPRAGGQRTTRWQQGRSGAPYIAPHACSATPSAMPQGCSSASPQGLQQACLSSSCARAAAEAWLGIPISEMANPWWLLLDPKFLEDNRGAWARVGAVEMHCTTRYSYSALCAACAHPSCHPPNQPPPSPPQTPPLQATS